MLKKNLKKTPGIPPRSGREGKESVRTFFTTIASEELLLPAHLDFTKMAADSQPPDSVEPISHRDLTDLKQDIINSMSNVVSKLLQPLQSSIQDMAKEISEATKVAENAAEIALSLQDDVKSLQTVESKMQTRITTLENKWRQYNLKFRGFDEGAEESTDLAAFMSSWLAKALELEDGVAPMLARAQRLGPLALARKDMPRDILVQFIYQRSRDKILKVARQKGALTFKEQKIIVLLDLAPEILTKRRKLKPVTLKLHEAKIRFRWSPTSDINVYKNGLLYQASDEVTGKALLLALGIKLTQKDEEDLLPG